MLAASAIAPPSQAEPGWHEMDVPVIFHAGTMGGADILHERAAWAVGEHEGGGLVMRWDGTAWAIQPTPTVSNGLLTAVSARTENDVWAVGQYIEWQVDHGLAEHWDGTAWTVVPLPEPGGTPGLNDVKVLPGGGAIAVGDDGTKPWVVRWDGHAWSTMATPWASGELSSVLARGDRDIWVAGSGIVGHWDGRQWTDVGAPGPVNALTAAGPRPWAVGPDLVARWSGQAFVKESEPEGDANLISAAGDLRGRLWAGGRINTQEIYLARYSGGRWTRTPVPALATKTLFQQVATSPDGRFSLALVRSGVGKHRHTHIIEYRD
ncbi:hypothetical protein D5S17_19150 [Pseudonocardiaceae bacterium YIM PH 21723]|nr:hypothetical protein D5S17_19150 [Pseudonocardiaceae bacterium YIM PH 21723]